MNAAPDILVVDDDASFGRVLARSLQRRGFAARAVVSVDEALAACDVAPPTHAVLDLMLGSGDDGLRLMRRLRERVPGLRVLLLTGYASIATAVEAIKQGADDYLAKPADAAAVLRALGLLAADAEASVVAPRPTPWNRIEWEHLQRVLAEHGGNIAATARALGMHRRTLQRKLLKRPSPAGGEPPL
ncbi:response regulator transcription factor [Arenimonas alkanexedens]